MYGKLSIKATRNREALGEPVPIIGRPPPIQGPRDLAGCIARGDLNGRHCLDDRLSQLGPDSVNGIENAVIKREFERLEVVDTVFAV